MVPIITTNHPRVYHIWILPYATNPINNTKEKKGNGKRYYSCNDFVELDHRRRKNGRGLFDPVCMHRAPTYGLEQVVPARNEASQNKRNGETRSGKEINLATARSPLLRGVPGKRGPRDGHSPSHLAEIGCGPATISDETRWMGQRDTKVRNKSVLRGVLPSAPLASKPCVLDHPLRHPHPGTMQ